MPAQQSPPVNATPGTLDKMEAHVKHAAPASINLPWGLLLVNFVHLIRILQLAASRAKSASATSDMRLEMQAHAPCACLLPALIARLENMSTRHSSAVWTVQQARIRQTKDQSACCVARTHSRRCVVNTFLLVCAMLAGQERTATAQAVCLVNTKIAQGLLRARIVQLGHIPASQHSAVLFVQLAHTSRAEEASVSCVVRTRTLRRFMRRLLPVSAMLAGLERIVSAQAVRLANISPRMGLLRAQIVPLRNIRVHQHAAVSNV